MELRIGEWRADPAANELSRGAETVRVEPKAMEVLMLLAARPGRLVSREELFAAVWRGMVVGDEALTQCIIKLRRALGDNARAASYIETISKRGYRLIAPVAADEPAPPPASAVAPSRRRIATAALAGALALLAAGTAYVLASGAGFLADPEAAVHEPRAAALTVSVLPFEPLGGDGEHVYLARGIGNDLITELSRLPGVRLIASTGRPTSQSAPSARYVVTGSVQRLSETLRINIYLVDRESGRQLWAERYERPFSDLFAVQDEMLRKLGELLPGKLAQAARERAARRHTHSLEAYDLFLRAQARFLVRQAGDNEAARELYRKALVADPKFARAYAGLAMTHAMEHRLAPAPDPAALARALELAETARLIDPNLPEVHWALGFVHAQSRRHEQAIASLQKAIELNRSYADAYAFMGGIYTYVGQPARSVALLRTAMRLNPEAGYLYYLLLGRAYLFEKDAEQALLNLREAAARNPADVETRLYLAAAMVAGGDLGSAEWEGQQIRSLDAGFSVRGWLDAYPLTSTPHRDMLSELLAQTGL
jgi:DNA-binding winged helix-turn-helix (wHTH) protein/TolB-like protein/Tfp pilus assembly protein PilF